MLNADEIVLKIQIEEKTTLLNNFTFLILVLNHKMYINN